MYERWWDLAEPAFLNNFDNRLFVTSQRTDEATARLQFLVDNRRLCGIVTGPSGVGKSFLIRNTLRHLTAPVPKIAIVDVAGLPYETVLRDLAAALHAPPNNHDSDFVVWRSVIDQIVGGQLADCQTVVVFDHIDQAGPGGMQVLERLLNLRSAVNGGYTLIASCCQITSHALQQAADLQIKVAAMDESETVDYLQERLRLAGRVEPIFDDEAVDTIYQQSGGIPRVVNRLCELSMLASVSEHKLSVDSRTVQQVALESLTGPAAA
jgi:general secretion pathway protein A